MKIYLIISIARQVDGEYCVVKTEKAYVSEDKANSFIKNLSKKYVETIPTPNGPIDCVCERGIFEVDVEE